MSTSLGRQGGFLVIDHSASPGIPRELAEKWAARGIPVAAEGKTLEADTYTCPHCERIVIKQIGSLVPKPVCRKCMRYTCARCGALPYDCTPFEKIFEQVARKTLEQTATGLLLPAGTRLP